MDILDTAKELGIILGNSKEIIALKDSEAALQADDRAKTLMNDYKQLQIEMVKATKANKSEAELEEIKEMLLLKQEEINNYQVTNNYLGAKTAFDQLLKKVNDVILFGMTGEEPCSPSKCGSCGGCK